MVNFRKRVQNAAPVALFPKEARLGIWGGEGIIFGYLRPKNQRGFTRPQHLATKLWRPRLLKLLFYSEITNKYYSLTCTRRTLNLIEEAQGFDNYILKVIWFFFKCFLRR
jgi:large subunit ribosomal protein L28